MVSVIASGEDRRILKQLRDESSTLVLMVRLENEKRKDEWRKQSEQTRQVVKQSFSDESLDTLFGSE